MLAQLLVLLYLHQSGHALQLVAPLSHRARIGEDVNIPCSFTINNPPINQKFLAISWFFQGKEILSVQNAKVRSIDPRVSYTGRTEDGAANLSISNIAVMDGGIYKCSILYTPKKEEKEIRLDIQATPQINITDRVVVTNKKSSLHGVISGFYPVDIDIKWFRDGEILDNVIFEIPQRDPDGTYSVNSSVTITPTEEDRERIFSCRIQHESLTAPLQEDFQLVYGEIPSIHITSQAFKLDVEQSLVCSVSGFYPESISVNWFLNDTLLENAKTRRISGSAVASVYNFIPTEQSWGMELRCVVEHGTLTTPHVERLLVQATDMRAQYKPHTVIASVVLVCVSGAVTIVLLLIKQRRKRLPKVRKITRGPGGVFSLGVDHFYPEKMTVSWKVIQPPSSTQLRPIGSVIIMDQNQDGTFNATSTCESLRGAIQENEPYTVQAVVEHDKLKHPSVREWRSDDKDNKDFLLQPHAVMTPIPKLFVDRPMQLQCRISNFYPDELMVSWFKKEKGDTELNQIGNTGKYKIVHSKSVHQWDKTFTHKALLEFTPSMEDQGSEVICKVNHPSLEDPIERTTGPLQVLVKPEVQQPIQLPINDSGDMVATFSLFSFYPEDIKVTWMYGPTQEKIPSEETIRENPDGTFTVTSQCTIPGNLFDDSQFRVRVTWEHPSMKSSAYREMCVRDPDFPWRPKVEGITPFILQEQQTSTMMCKISGYFPNNLKVTWLEKRGKSVTDCTQNTRYHIPDIRHERMADNSYQCSPSLSFTPTSVTEDLEFICRVVHPSLEHPIEQSTGPARANVAPQEPNDVKLTPCGADRVLCSLSLLKFYPKSINITWTSEECKNKTLDSTKKIIQTNDEKIFDATSECILPWDYFRSSVRVTWTHDSLKEAGSRDLHTSDFPWHPVIEEAEKPALLVNTKARLQYKISNYFPNDLSVTWYKKKDGELCSLDANTIHHTTTAQLQPNDTYSCTASLQFTPTLPEDQGSEFICEVQHPSLKHRVKTSTGPLEVFESPVEVDPVRLTLCQSGDVLCSVRLKVFAKNIHLAWTSGGNYTQLPSNKFLLEGDDGKMLNVVISECRIPWGGLQFPIRFGWKYDSMAGPQYTELQRTDLPWHPRIEILSTPSLICDTESMIQYKIYGYFPDNLTVSWHKKKMGTDNFDPLEKDKRYKKDITESKRESDYTYSCTASLVFTPTMEDDNRADFMCSVRHPSLEKPIQKTTGSTPVLCLQDPHVEEIDTSFLVLNTECEIKCIISGYFPRNLTVSWHKKKYRTEKIKTDKNYNLPVITHQTQPDNTYSCTAILRFTPLQKKDQGIDFICKVEHPSLVKPIERHTGPLPIKEIEKPKESASWTK